MERVSGGKRAIEVVGLSEIVREKEAIFIDGYERGGIVVLDPADTELVVDESSHYEAGLLYMESQLRRIPPTDQKIYVGHRAAMDALEYQLDPAEQALKQPRQRILIADAVGLGKTLEAGILLSELIARGRGKRILVVAVKSMLTQFQKELWSRFTIPLVRLDSIGLQRIRRRIPTNQNPFYYYDKAIISVDTLKQNNEYRTYLENAHWDVIVIDEAHNVAIRGKRKSQRARLAELLSRQSDTLIMLSATPHDGRAKSFASLMNMLDPTAIADEENYTPEDIEGLFIRRFKKDVADQLEKHFPDRQLYHLQAQASEAEEAAFDAFDSLSFSALDQRRGGHMLFKTSLLKGLLSSPAACLKSVEGRIGRLEKRDDAGRFAADIAQLRAFAERLRAIGPEDFAKYQHLLALLQDGESVDDSPFGFSGHFRTDRLVIFTERIDTMTWLAEHLPRDLGLDRSKVEVLHGGMSDIDQQRIVEDFGKEKADVRLLIASDVASEGINLHYFCHRMIHFDIPWSLMVFQQRNGRIDRYGQTETPHIGYLYTESRNERIEADTRILEILIEKDQQAIENIGDPSALMGVYDVEEQEAFTAAAIESGAGADAFEAQLVEGDVFDQLLAKVAKIREEEAARQGGEFGGLGEGGESGGRRGELESLYGSDYDYLVAALDYFRKSRPLEFEADPERRRVALQLTESLKRRFEKLPDEVLPEDGRLLLSSDEAAMQESIAMARAEESAWPALHYLWRHHPLMDWVNDRLEGNFGRHTAPVISVSRGLQPGESLYVLSTLIPNLKSQPLLHRWFGVRFAAGSAGSAETSEVLGFEEVRELLDLGGAPLPNRLDPVDLERLTARLPRAVEVATAEMREVRRQFEDRINARLQEELDKLEMLKERQLRFAEERYEATGDQSKFDQRRRAIDALFDDYFDWVEESMTTEDTPFVQVIAVFTNEASQR